ncbi:hypothetical protein LZ554_002926 [Drepanopeziza brunnea f. sp. 'monogermtubi']|nr:hypothetical protein LZ554_002926 [Drepanopeziza brunnea f. sp. 'monogermtubi']
MGTGTSRIQRATRYGTPRTASVFNWPADRRRDEVAATELEAKNAEIREMRDRVNIALEERDHEISERSRENEELTARCQDWATKCGDLEKRNSEVERHNEELTLRNRYREDAHEAMERKNLDAEKKLADALSQIEGLENQLQLQSKEAEEDRHRLHAQAAVLRGMVVKNGRPSAEQIDDQTIAASFVSLRDQIQRISFKLCSGEVTELIVKDLRQRCPIFLGMKKREQLRNRVRAVLFNVIFDVVLQRKCFGLEGFGQSAELESGLARFEAALLQLDAGHEAEIVDWRIQTLRCASWMGLANTSLDQVACKILDLMQPLWPKSDTASDKLLGLVRRLCNDSLKFVLVLRSSRDSYICEMPAPKSRLTEDSDVQDQELCPDVGSRSQSWTSTDQEVLFPIAGALVKYPEHHAAVRLVLEKAHVVVCQQKKEAAD